MALGRYFVRRFLRIAPLYYLVLTGVLVAQVITGGANVRYLHMDGGIVGYFRHLIFFQGDSVFWTIPCEVSFYVLLPFIVIAMVARPWIFFALSGSALIFYIWFMVVLYGGAAGLPGPKLVDISHHSQFLDVFLCGVLGAWLFQTQRSSAWVMRHGVSLDRIACGLFLGVLFAIVVATSEKFLWWNRPLYDLRWQSLPIGIIFTAFIFCVNRFSGWCRFLVNLGWLKWMGVLAFSWYLLHFPIFQLLNEWQQSIGVSGPWISLAYFVVAFVLCGIVSMISYRCIEKPFMDLGRRLTASTVPSH